MNAKCKKIVKNVGRILLALVVCVGLAFAGLVVYARYFYESEPEAESYYVDSLPLTPDRFQDDFDEIAKIVKENYSLSESKHLDVDSLCSEYASRVNGIRDTKGYGELLEEFFAALNVGHASVYLKSYTAGMSPVLISDSVFISRPDSLLLRAGVRDKDRVIAVNGELVGCRMDENEKYVPSSTPLNRRVYAAADLFRSLSDTIRDYTLCRGLDTVHVSLSLVPYASLPAVDTPATVAMVMDDSIGYLAINTMMDGVLESFASDFGKIRNMPCLIIDVRDNGGGNSGNGRELCRYFIRKGQPHCIDGKMMSPAEDAYQGKIVLLTGPKTFSAAESFVIDMKESGNAILIGEPTAGDTGNRPRTFRTSSGICFRIPTAAPAVSPKGFPLEGVGIAPDRYVPQTVTDFMNDTDTQLEYARRYFMPI